MDIIPDTAWSANAVATYTSITRPAATRLIGFIEELGAITTTRGSTKPRRRLNPPCEIKGYAHLNRDPQWVWLPTKLVAPNESDKPLLCETVLERLLESGKPSLLKTLINLYALHDLEQHFGIPFDVLHVRYTREKLGEWAEFNIWGFREDGIWESSPNAHATLDDVSELQNMGIVGFVPHVVNRTDVKRPIDTIIYYPVPQQTTSSGVEDEAEKALGSAHAEAAVACLADFHNARWARDGGPDILVVEKRHFAEIGVVGLLRLASRPLTGSTIRWLERRVDWEVMAAKLGERARDADLKRRPYLRAVS